MKYHGLIHWSRSYVQVGTALLCFVLICLHVEDSEAWGSSSSVSCLAASKITHGKYRGRYRSALSMYGFYPTSRITGNTSSGRVSAIFAVTEKDTNSSLEASFRQDREKLLLEELETLTGMFESVQSSVQKNSELFQKKLETKQKKVDELKLSLLSTEKKHEQLVQKLESMKESSNQAEQEWKGKIEELRSKMKVQKKESDQKMKDYVRENAEHVGKERKFKDKKYKEAKETWKKSTQVLELKIKALETELEKNRENSETRIAQLERQKRGLETELLESQENCQSIQSRFTSSEAIQQLQQNEQNKQTDDMQRQLIQYEAERNSVRKLLRLMFRRLTFLLRIRRRKVN